MGDMGTQLVLLDTPTPSWKLDRHTREIGRRGVAEARERTSAGRRRRSSPAGPPAGRLTSPGGTDAHPPRARPPGRGATVLLAAAAVASRDHASAGRSGATVVVRVVDGDTVVVRVGGRDERRPADRHRHAGDGQARTRRCECFGPGGVAPAPSELLPRRHRRPARARRRGARPATAGCSPTSTGPTTARSSTSRWPTRATPVRSPSRRTSPTPTRFAAAAADARRAGRGSGLLRRAPAGVALGR